MTLIKHHLLLDLHSLLGDNLVEYLAVVLLQAECLGLLRLREAVIDFLEEDLFGVLQVFEHGVHVERCLRLLVAKLTLLVLVVYQNNNLKTCWIILICVSSVGVV